MPKVPVIQENQRLAPQNPTGFQSSSQARLMGDAVSGLGKGAMDLGSALLKVEKANYRNAGTQASSQYRREAVKLRSALAAKGYSADAQAKYEDEDKKLQTKISKEYTDKFGLDALEEITTAMSKTGAQEFEEFEMERNKMRIEFVKEQEAITENLENDDVFRSPKMLTQALGDMETDVNFKRDVVTDITQEKGEMIKQRRGRNLIASAIDGLINREDVINDPTKLNKILTSPEYAKYTDQKFRGELMDRAMAKRNLIVNQRNQEYDRTERIQAKELKVAQSLIESQFLEEMQDAVESNNIVAVDDILIKAGDQLGGENPRLSSENYKKLLTKKVPFAKQIDAIGTFKARELAYGEGNLDKAISFVGTENGRHLMPRNASALLKEFTIAKKSYASDPSLAAGDKSAYALHKQILGDVPMEMRLLGDKFLPTPENKDKLAKYFGVLSKYGEAKRMALTSGRKFNGPATMKLILEGETPEKFNERQILVGMPQRKVLKYESDTIGTKAIMESPEEWRGRILEWSNSPENLSRFKNPKAKEAVKQRLESIDKMIRDEAEMNSAIYKASEDDFKFYETLPNGDGYNFLNVEDEEGIPFSNKLVPWEI